MGCWDHLGEQPLEHEIGIKSVYQALGLLSICSICGRVTGQLTLLRHGRSGVCSFWSVSVGHAPPLAHLSMTVCHACFLCLRLRVFFSPQTRSPVRRGEAWEIRVSSTVFFFKPPPVRKGNFSRAGGSVAPATSPGSICPGGVAHFCCNATH